MKIALLSVAALALAACSSIPPLPAGNFVGEEMAPASVLPFAEVDADPEPYFNRSLLVVGEIQAVCQHAGCWMQIADEGRVATVRWETGCGGAYSFPKDAVGRTVVVQGTFYPNEADVDHLSAEAGDVGEVSESAYEFNASSILLVEESGD